MNKSELKKQLESATLPMKRGDYIVLYHMAELNQSLLIDELHAWKDVVNFLAWLKTDAEYEIPISKEEVRRAQSTLIEMACYRHSIEYPPDTGDRYEYLMKATKDDFFGGFRLASIVQILDSLLSQLENEQGLQE